jgi:zinc protease
MSNARRVPSPLAAVALLLLLAFPIAPDPVAAQVTRAVRISSALPPLTRVASVEGITEYSLPNGLRVLLFPDASKPTTTVNITYMVGSRHEGYGETGMAHLLEHMVFKGTPRHPNVPQELTEHGAQPNGTTWFDRTNYFETFSATDSNLAWALDLEADRMVHSYIAKKDLQSEFSVVRNEFESGENDPGGVLMDRTLSTAFLWHNYGKSTIGARSDIEQVPIERLQAFYRKYYQPDNSMLVIAGKFDEKRAMELVRQKFGRIPRPARTGTMQIYPTYTAEPTQDGERSVTLRRVGDVQVINAVYHVPAGSHPDYPAVDVLSSILGEAPAGRLYKALVETRKAASVFATGFQLREPGVLVLGAQVRQEDPMDSVRTTMLQTVADLATNPPTAEEVNRAKAALLRRIELSLNNSARVGLELSEWQSMGDWRLLFLNRDRIRAVTPDDVKRVAAAYLKPSNLTLGIFVPTPKPDRSEVPPPPDVVALVKDYRGDTARSVGEAFDPSPAVIEQRTTRSVLPSGLKVALLPKKTRGGTVVATMLLHFGTEQSLMNRAAAADMAADMLLRGTKTRTRQQIRDELDRLKAQVSIGGSATGTTVRIETIRENLAPVLAIVAEALTQPAFDPKEFEELRRENLAGLEQQKSEPIALGSIAFSRYVNPWPKGHPRYTPTLDEQVADYTAVTLADARKYYDDFYGATNAELAIVGDFDQAAVARQVAELFGGWKSAQPFTRVRNVYRDRPPTTVSIETPDKANAFFLAGMNLPVRDDDPGYPALVLGNYMLGGGFLNSRLATRIRQKEGISYGVGSGLSAPAQDSAGIFQAYAIYAPENVARLEAAFRDEMTRAIRDGFTADELNKAREGYLQQRQLQRAQDGSLAAMLANDLFLGRTLSYDTEFERRVAALTPAELNAAMRRYIDPARITIVKAGDFAKKAPPPQP